jgi:tetratricopeptide (TPR) repeat protein
VETRAALLERDVADLRVNAPLAIQASKDIADVEGRQREVNTRVDDLKARIGDLTIAISLIAPCLTLLAIGVGVAAYWTAGKRAEAAAEDWMEKHASQLQKRIEGLEVEAEKITVNMRQHEQDVVQSALGAREIIDGEADTIRRLRSQISTEISRINSGGAAEPSVGDQRTMKQVDDALKAKPEKDYTAKDWEKRALAAYAERDFERAAFYFQQAADASSESLDDWSNHTIRRAAMLGELGRMEECIEVYDTVVERLGDTTDRGLRVRVAEALINKGLTLNNFGDFEKAVVVYDDIVARFGDAGDGPLKELVSFALELRTIPSGMKSSHT